MAWLLVAVAAVFVASLVLGFMLTHLGVLVIAGVSYAAWTYYQSHHRGFEHRCVPQWDQSTIHVEDPSRSPKGTQTRRLSARMCQLSVVDPHANTQPANGPTIVS